MPRPTSRARCARWRSRSRRPRRAKASASGVTGQWRPRRKERTMGLHDRIKGQNTPQNGDAGAEAPVTLAGAPQQPREERPSTTVDPYAELKTRIHHACIAKLGPQLFTTETTEDLHEQVHRAVTEQLALDRTPLTREERRRIVRELTDDILGYGPLEPLLRDDDITEVMCNNWDQIFIERDGKLERTHTSFADNAHLLRIID